MSITRLYEIMQNNNILYSVVANLDDNSIETAGDKSKLEYTSLLDNLFSNVECVYALNDSLKGQLMPQAWNQGKEKCLVCKPVDNVVIGLFYHEDKNAIESYKFGKMLNDKIKEKWVDCNR